MMTKWRLPGPNMHTHTVNHFRCNVIDQSGTVSFTAPPHGLKVIAAAISRGAQSLSELLFNARTFDAEWVEAVYIGLMVFDEHNVDNVDDAFRHDVEEGDAVEHRAFRVIDHATRQRSLVPSRLGLVVVNMKERRIIQIHNNYDDLRRKDRGRVRIHGEPTNLLFHYELPPGWSLLP